MQRKYGPDGVVCVSVSVDALDNKQATFDFLKEQGATLPNFLLDEETEVWQNKWDVNGPPAVFVFDRENRRAAKFDISDPDKPFTHEDVEKVVRDLLRQPR